MKCSSAIIAQHFGKPYLALEIPEREMIDWLKHYETRMPMDIEIKTKRKHRSKDANSYMWVLADRIAEAIGITKEEVYRKHLRDVGVFDDVWIKTEAVETFCRNWESNGVGWIAEPMHERKGWTAVRTYYGSSTYNTKEMSRLIDSIVEEAKEWGLEVLTPDELERMKQAWNTK